MDGVGRHGLHPEALDGLIDLPNVHDILKDEFALATGIASIDDLRYGL